jgi:hypothetical protein
VAQELTADFCRTINSIYAAICSGAIYVRRTTRRPACADKGVASLLRAKSGPPLERKAAEQLRQLIVP